MGESRQELVSWVNYTLDLEITKVEQCGTGAVYCQLFDSIHLDVPMAKVKFNVNTEYQYLNNFKILQSCFMKHRIDRSVPVERLVKCKFQDNLEFLQWFKKYWDSNFPGHEYNAVERRKGQQVAAGAGPGAPRPGSAATSGGPASSRAGVRTISSSANRTGSAAGRPTAQAARPNPRASTAGGAPAANPRRSTSTASSGYAAPAAGGPAARKMAPPGASQRSNGVAGGAGSAGGARAMQALQESREYAAALEQENEEMGRECELVRNESAFYFDKLREIEVLTLTASQLFQDRKAKLAAAGGNNASSGSSIPHPDEPSNDTNKGAASDITAGLGALGISDLEVEENPELALLNYETLLNEIQSILYFTAEGFERPDEAEGDEEMGYEHEEMDMGETF